ncbi:hypothetical protein [Bacteriovorax sp. Seq25_V]|uniref:hypothetical protein n=1 Tax=Bacteriovorax sp. Seq25_V TaxID=1201288 RepID=UPI00038A3533|nr:hypothetical protein [Bacteriovorax sp. Seq25_V]EQC46579.1 hypothetical protein M900_2445 [Bacteriovorax sp. Seq25_V]
MNLLIIGVGHLAKILIAEIRNDNQSKIKTITGTSRDLTRISNLGLDEVVEFSKIDELLKKKTFDHIVFTLPPIPDYQALIERIHVECHSKSKWTFVSSTGVYHQGRNSAALISNENFLRSLSREVYIVRPGGLIDEKRNPVFVLSRKDEVDGFNQPVNVVHTLDVARFIKFLIENDIKVDDYDLVSDDSMTKSEFYGPFFGHYNLKIPKMNDSENKTTHLSNIKSKDTGFKYIAPAIFEYIAKRD